MPQKLIAALNWIKDNVLAVLIASFVIPGILSVFNQQFEITKAIYETDYKGAKTKFLECDRLHSDYLAAAGANAGAAQVLQEHFNPDTIAKKGSSEIYFVAFKGTMETYQKSLGQVQELFTKTSRCHSELAGNYENLALSLDLIDEFQNETKQGAEKVSSLIARRDTLAKNLLKRADPNAIFGALISGDEKSIQIAMQTANFGDLAKLQSQNIELESAVQNQQRVQFSELNKLFAKELNRRFHRGLFSYFWSLVRI
ncbi:hypothetical protein [Duganella violaceipulchra]|uniref:Uncharacterized protein n=1 Tax=Duganella violaceipulchra TaxID=2849652 RepID=A0AA41LAU7_9BURK|nr:hypothetical protein [Duganella violaceicalia]MBV6324640.1 hypothetical protein [Duganella violaceicalia]MCP2009915.1 hypothetical protein [Duganella violaceicalia]